jgi:hypothetical protein
MQAKMKMGDVKRITIYHSKDICVVRQFGFWYDTNAMLHLVPCKPFGLVAVVPSNVRFGQAQPSYGYLLFRPRALELVHDAGIKSDLVAVESLKLQEWYKAFDPWVHVRPKAR